MRPVLFSVPQCQAYGRPELALLYRTEPVRPASPFDSQDQLGVQAERVVAGHLTDWKPALFLRFRFQLAGGPALPIPRRSP
jgi:hypothetical protein